MFGMNLALVSNNIGLMWVAVEIATLDHRADGRHLSHPRGAGGGLEIFHPRQRRHRARAVRHHPGLHGGPAGRRRGLRRHGLDGADRATPRAFDPALAQRRLHLPASRLRNQGRPRAAARLAARRPRRGPDPDLGRALGPAAQRRALLRCCASRSCSPPIPARSRPAR